MFYYLPRTELELQLDLRLETVTPGLLSKHVEACANNPGTDYLCEKEAEHKFKLTKPSSSNELCHNTDVKNARTSTRYYGLGDKTSITAIAVPDSSQLYFVEVTPGWWQTITASIQYSDTGLASEMTAGGSNAAINEITKFISGKIFSKFSSPTSSAALDEILQSVKGQPAGSVADEKERLAVMQKLQDIEDRRTDIVMRLPIAGDPTAILAALDVREKELRAIYEGIVKADSILMVRGESLREKGSKGLGEDIRWENGTIPPVSPVVEVTGCSIGGAPAGTMALPIQIAFSPEPNAHEVAKAQDEARPEVGSRQQGFRYRIPIPVKASLHKNADTLDSTTQLVDKEYPLEIAQLGPTLTLPRKAGVWGGTVGATFVANTGRLKLFKTDASSNPAGAIITQVQTDASKDRALEALEKEEHELDLKVKIEAHKEELKEDAPPE